METIIGHDSSHRHDNNAVRKLMKSKQFDKLGKYNKYLGYINFEVHYIITFACAHLQLWSKQMKPANSFKEMHSSYLQEWTNQSIYEIFRCSNIFGVQILACILQPPTDRYWVGWLTDYILLSNLCMWLPLHGNNLHCWHSWPKRKKVLIL